MSALGWLIALAIVTTWHTGIAWVKFGRAEAAFVAVLHVFWFVVLGAFVGACVLLTEAVG